MNFNRPKRRSFDDWMKDLQKLSGKTDVSQDDLTDAQIQEAFAQDPKHSAFPDIDAKVDLGTSARRKEYALAECAEGRHREQYPNDPTND